MPFEVVLCSNSIAIGESSAGCCIFNWYHFVYTLRLLPHFWCRPLHSLRGHCYQSTINMNMKIQTNHLHSFIVGTFHQSTLSLSSCRYKTEAHVPSKVAPHFVPPKNQTTHILDSVNSENDSPDHEHELSIGSLGVHGNWILIEHCLLTSNGLDVKRGDPFSPAKNPTYTKAPSLILHKRRSTDSNHMAIPLNLLLPLPRYLTQNLSYAYTSIYPAVAIPSEMKTYTIGNHDVKISGSRKSSQIFLHAKPAYWWFILLNAYLFKIIGGRLHLIQRELPRHSRTFSSRCEWYSLSSKYIAVDIILNITFSFLQSFLVLHSLFCIYIDRAPPHASASIGKLIHWWARPIGADWQLPAGSSTSVGRNRHPFLERWSVYVDGGLVRQCGCYFNQIDSKIYNNLGIGEVGFASSGGWGVGDPWFNVSVIRYFLSAFIAVDNP